MKSCSNGKIILGAGITGLTAGYNTGLPIFEAEDIPGGICASYYIKAKQKLPLYEPSGDREVYRFETGGGHWVFGCDQEILRFIKNFVPVKSYTRNSSAYFNKKKLYIPYPVQHNLKLLTRKFGPGIINEIRNNPAVPHESMKKWLFNNFGPALCKIFFFPFHHRYTAGLYSKIAPQDQYKSPSLKVSGKHIGYSATFFYPRDGLNDLIKSLAKKCNIYYGKRVTKIDARGKRVYFSDNSSIQYKAIISTLPLNKVIKMSNLSVKARSDPYASVLVLNIGALKGKHCPAEHWLYIPDAKTGFYRIGFYSNVDSSFLPNFSRKTGDRVSIYVERSFRGGKRLSDKEVESYSKKVVEELRSWGFIKDPEVMHTNWIDVAYTWSWQSSSWKEKALGVLRKNAIYQIGRYGKWQFQGIADSIREGIHINEALF